MKSIKINNFFNSVQYYFYSNTFYIDFSKKKFIASSYYRWKQKECLFTFLIAAMQCISVEKRLCTYSMWILYTHIYYVCRNTLAYVHTCKHEKRKRDKAKKNERNIKRDDEEGGRRGRSQHGRDREAASFYRALKASLIGSLDSYCSIYVSTMWTLHSSSSCIYNSWGVPYWDWQSTE